MLTQLELKSILHYDPKTGTFTRLTNKGPSKKGDVAGTQSHPRGYVQISVKSKSYYAHRLAWLYMKGYMPEMVDHINGNTSDNKFANLRKCSMSENMQNLKQSGSSKNKSGHIGVYCTDGKWYATIRCIKNNNRKKLRYGPFGTKKEAIAAYNSAKTMLHQFQPELIR